MNQYRFARPVASAAGFCLLYCAAGLASDQTGSASTAKTPAQARKMAPPAASAKSTLDDDFAGFDYTDEQKSQMEKIRQDSKTRKDAVGKDTKLTADQKDALIQGYTRMEYGFMFKVLTPEQQRQLRSKLRTRRAADIAAKHKQPPPRK